jgi:hypothetical protein
LDALAGRYLSARCRPTTAPDCLSIPLQATTG